jgi:hypothetical protein
MEVVKKYSRQEVGQIVARYYRGETDGAEVHTLARGLQIERGLSYADALNEIMKVRSDAPDDHRLSEARKTMNELIGDPAATRRMAGLAVYALAQRHLKRYTQQTYQDALNVVNRQYPTLWHAYDSGRLQDGDFGTLGLILDQTQERNYADDTTVKKYDFPA